MHSLARFIPQRTLSLILSLGAATACGSTGVHPDLAGVDSSVPVTAFLNVTVIPMDTDRVLTGQTVLVRGTRITMLGRADRVHVPAGAVLIDAGGKFLIPGMADMHTHMQFEDSVANERDLLRDLASGVTTIRNVDFLPDSSQQRGIRPPDLALAGGRLLRLRARAASGAILSPRIYTSGPWHGTTDGRAVDAATAIPAYKAAGYDFIKIHDEDRETFDSVVAAAHRVGIPVIGHLPEGVSLEQALAVGYRSLEHGYGYPGKKIRNYLDSLTKQGINLGKYLDTVTVIPGAVEIAEATRRAGVWNCLTLVALGKHGKETDVTPGTRRLIQALQNAEAGLLAGTDAFFRSSGNLAEVSDELTALVRAGLTPYQALLTSTRNVAVYFGTLNESGTVTVDKRADLVLLDGNPFKDIRNTAHVAGVMLGGRWFSKGDLDQRLAAAPLGRFENPLRSLIR